MTYFLDGYEMKSTKCKDVCLQTVFKSRKMIRRRLYSNTYNKNIIEIMFTEPVYFTQHIQGIVYLILSIACF